MTNKKKCTITKLFFYIVDKQCVRFTLNLVHYWKLINSESLHLRLNL